MLDGAAGAAPRLEDRTVMITGASRGLGAALATAFAGRGARVSICARDGTALDETADRVRGLGAECVAAEVDVTDAAAVAAWVERTEAQLGPPVVLINNASVLGPRVGLAEYPLEQWRQVLEVNLTGAFVVTGAVLPRMLAAGRGSVISVTSGAAVLPRVKWGAYSVSKYALEGWSTNLARELDGTGVRVNLVDPGAMRTGMRAAAYPAEDPATLKTPEQTTGIFLWLASDASLEVTGRRFSADRWRAGTAG
jgi:NAD(P)-dependent dehydrogenase (short-subunit alcohol dehydrogenase family)